MTAQISDTVHYQKKRYRLAGISGSELFDPSLHGIKPVMISTACWRGYYCGYVVEEGTLFLAEIHLGLGEEDAEAAAQGNGPRLFGKIPRRYMEHGESLDLQSGKVNTSWESWDFKVDGIRELIPFTGGLLLGDDFILDLYVHMGFHHAYKFRTVHEMIFDSGRLTEEHDHSARMAEIREMISPESLEPGSRATRGEIERWIEQCFSLKYTRFSS